MANKKLAAPPALVEPLEHMSDADRADEATATTALSTHVTAIEQLYGDGYEYLAERSIAKVQAHLGSSAEHFLQAGRELIRLREHEDRGQFLFIVEHRLGLAPRAAQKMMQAAAKFLTSDGTVRPLLADSANSSGKVIELLTLDDEDLDAIEQGERVSGITKDDVVNMSVTELRKALRAGREERSADQTLIDQKDEKINKLQRALTKAQRGGVEFEEHAYLDTINEAQALAQEGLKGIVAGLAVLADAQNALAAIEVPRHLDDVAKRAPVMTLHSATLQIAESLARVMWEQEQLFARHIADAPRTLAAFDGLGVDN